MKLKLIIAGIAFAGLFVAQADNILWDLNAYPNPTNDATVTEFTALGVTEDLTGATVSQVIASENLPMTDGTISLSYLTATVASGTSDTGTLPNAIVRDYIYGADAGPIQMQISGLNGLLTPSTTYGFYLIGAGDGKDPDQGTAFTFDNVTKNTSSAGTTLNTIVRFEFTTAESVANTLNFTWDQLGASNTYSALNGFVIAAIPEPATLGLIGFFSISMLLGRRVIFRKQNNNEGKIS